MLKWYVLSKVAEFMRSFSKTSLLSITLWSHYKLLFIIIPSASSTLSRHNKQIIDEKFIFSK